MVNAMVRLLPRTELLNESLFPNLAHARELMAAWVRDYNTARPLTALGYQTPAGFALHLTTAIARHAGRDESSAPGDCSTRANRRKSPSGSGRGWMEDQ